MAYLAAQLEKDLQAHIEANMEICLGVRLLASEYRTGKTHKGRMDSLGLDESSCPVIVEYKRHSNENVINQGLFYLDWLMDHQAEFQWLVMEKLGKETAESIEWQGTRLICIAADFTRYDEHAVQQINRNIELMRYRYFGYDLLLLELVNAQTAEKEKVTASASNAIALSANDKALSSEKSGGKDKTHQQRLAEVSTDIRAIYEQASEFIEQLGDEVQRKELVTIQQKKLDRFFLIKLYFG